MLNVSERFRINADNYNIIVEENINRKNRKTKEETKVWLPVAYYGRLDQALDYIMQREVHSGISEGITKLNTRISKLGRDIKEFKGTYKDFMEGR